MMTNKFRMKTLNKTRILNPYYYRTHEKTKNLKFTAIEHCDLNCAPEKFTAKAC